MNARQKAKKYKKELEYYKKYIPTKPILFDSYPVKPVTIAASKKFDRFTMHEMSVVLGSELDTFILRELGLMMCNNHSLLECLNIHERTDEYLNCVEYRATLTVLPNYPAKL